jgi:hypothetical protein
VGCKHDWPCRSRIVRKCSTAPRAARFSWPVPSTMRAERMAPSTSAQLAPASAKQPSTAPPASARAHCGPGGLLARAECPPARQFAAMRPSAVFVSIGRGSVVDEAALAAAVRSGRSALLQACARRNYGARALAVVVCRCSLRAHARPRCPRVFSSWASAPAQLGSLGAWVAWSRLAVETQHGLSGPGWPGLDFGRDQEPRPVQVAPGR